jgi:hypothetical protein
MFTLFFAFLLTVDSLIHTAQYILAFGTYWPMAIAAPQPNIYHLLHVPFLLPERALGPKAIFISFPLIFKN